MQNLTAEQRKRFLFLRTNAKRGGETDAYPTVAEIAQLCERAGLPTTEQDAEALQEALVDYWQAQANAALIQDSETHVNPTWFCDHCGHENDTADSATICQKCKQEAMAILAAEAETAAPATCPAEQLRDVYKGLVAERIGGVKHDAGKAPLGMLPASALEAIAHVFAFGADKYTRDNWQAVVTEKPRRYVDAALRHIYAHADGRTTDGESGLPHLAHAGACLLFLLWAMDEGLDV